MFRKEKSMFRKGIANETARHIHQQAETRIANRHKGAQKAGPSIEKLTEELAFAYNDAMEQAIEVSRGEWLITDDAGEEYYGYYDAENQTFSVVDPGGNVGWDYKVEIKPILTPIKRVYSPNTDPTDES